MRTENSKKVGKKMVKHTEDSVSVISTRDWWRNIAGDPSRKCVDYVNSLLPIFGWIHRYRWAYGDLVAGITVGIVAVPQSMSYAQIATLPPEVGLYSSFIGVLVYVFFATSKDISIGPVAVMSLTVSQIIKHVNDTHPDMWSAPQIATTIALLCGLSVLAIGLLRLGWLVEFIPAPAVSGFMTGSAISILAGQVPSLLGLSGFDTRTATYKILLNSIRHLPYARLDALFGISGLVALYFVRSLCEKMSKRYPSKARFFFFLNVFRNALVIFVLTIASWIYCSRVGAQEGKYPIKILQGVPRGFRALSLPTVDPKLVSAVAPEIPVATIILFLEHIAISKSFGRVNNYKINADQELIAIGVTNVLGTLFGAYPATGSFSRSALQSKSGCRTPAAGLFCALVVVVALYGLTPAFFYIPSAALSAVIIHAVADLVASPTQAYKYWQISPVEACIWGAAVTITLFATIDDGIYFSVAASLVLLLVRLAKPRGNFLGKLTVKASKGPGSGSGDEREVFVPLRPDANIINPHLKITPPTPGVVVYRYEESFLYPNCSLLNDAVVEYVKKHTRRGKDMSCVSEGERPWNDAGGLGEGLMDAGKPLLRAVVLDFSAISHIDTTGVQALLDTRNELERWADGPVEFHFASILSPWIRRSLVASGFGVPTGSDDEPMHHHEVAPVTRYHDDYISDPAHAEDDFHAHFLERGQHLSPAEDPEGLVSVETYAYSYPSSSRSSFTAIEDEDDVIVEEDAMGHAHVVPRATPFFHFDLAAAVHAAERAVERPVVKGYGTFQEVKGMH